MASTTDSPESFQLSVEAAESYEALFVPAFFAQWAATLCEAAGVRAGDAVLDVACGTGIVARTAADVAGPAGRIVGLDISESMLSVARRVRPDVEWVPGDAGAMSLPDDTFDVVMCQMALMFFPDRPAAIGEMARVVHRGGAVAVLVPARLDAQAAFAPFVAMAARHAGPDAVALLSTYFACGDLDELGRLLGAVGLDVEVAATRTGTYRAPSVDAFVATEVDSTPLRERITDAVYERMRAGATEVLAPFVRSDGGVEAPFESNLVVARRRM